MKSSPKHTPHDRTRTDNALSKAAEKRECTGTPTNAGVDESPDAEYSRVLKTSGTTSRRPRNKSAQNGAVCHGKADPVQPLANCVVGNRDEGYEYDVDDPGSRVDDKNRTRLRITGRCNYHNVLELIQAIVLWDIDARPSTRFTEPPESSGSCCGRLLKWEVDPTLDEWVEEEDGTVLLYIRSLLRYKDVSAYDLNLVDIIWDEVETPDDLRFIVNDAEIENALVGVMFQPCHDPHNTTEADGWPVVLIRGKASFLREMPVCSLEVTIDGERYRLDDDVALSLTLDDMSVDARFVPTKLTSLETGREIEGDEMARMLRRSILTKCISNNGNIFELEDFIVEGVRRPVEIDCQKIMIELCGFSTKGADVVRDLTVRSGDHFYKLFNMNREFQYHETTGGFSLFLKPTVLLGLDGQLMTRDNMLSILKYCSLTGIDFQRNIANDELIEIASFRVNGEFHDIRLGKNCRHARLFRYIRPESPGTEENAEQDDELTDFLLVAKKPDKAPMPKDIQVYLEVTGRDFCVFGADDEFDRKAIRYKLVCDRTRICGGRRRKDTMRTILFEKAYFEADDASSRVMHPSELIGMSFAFHFRSNGKKSPVKMLNLKWGGIVRVRSCE